MKVVQEPSRRGHIFAKPKDAALREEQTDALYSIWSNFDCDHENIGHLKYRFGALLEEHQRRFFFAKRTQLCQSMDGGHINATWPTLLLSSFGVVPDTYLHLIKKNEAIIAINMDNLFSFKKFVAYIRCALSLPACSTDQSVFFCPRMAHRETNLGQVQKNNHL